MLKALGKTIEVLFAASFHLILFGFLILAAIVGIMLFGPIGLILLCIFGILLLKN